VPGKLIRIREGDEVEMHRDNHPDNKNRRPHGGLADRARPQLSPRRCPDGRHGADRNASPRSGERSPQTFPIGEAAFCRFQRAWD
jgi:hypothetical protein